ncbi:MAG: hypothetical protein SHS37scaffold145_29 [Phage 71_18]|nr:MAG: hypothetical protein SHS37scaffold145_29 [Phage 71_18]
MSDRPLIRVAHPTVEGIPLTDCLVVTCSGCADVDGDTELTGWENAQRRPWLQRQAYLHAQEAHDGDVDREGWA